MLPLPEYPRPALRRDSYVCLNGPWDYAITDTPAPPQAYEGAILVPYSPEAPASGVGRTLRPGQWLHYRRRFAVPAGQGSRVLLHFGAVDYECAVTVNGRLAGGHRGGYWPFTLDITDCLNDEKENILLVSVQDPTDTGTQARGKQKLRPGGMFYTAQSGIWQTVWLERVPDNYITDLQVTADYDARTVRVRVSASRPGGGEMVHAVLRADGVCIAEDWGSACGEREGEVELAIFEDIFPGSFRPWSPEDPFLYDLTVSLHDGDTVQSYVAMRKFSVERDSRGVLRFCLNGAPYLLHGLLDQGYWPQGLYTPPSDEAMAQDIRTAKELGFDLLRKHAKIEPERWYYHCDRLGMVVWQDMVNGGGPYAHWFVTYLANIFQPMLRRLPDGRALWPLLGRADEASRAEYAAELEATIRALRHHPCIGCWVPFNEGWGQFDAAAAAAQVRELDPERLVDEASGWFDQGGGDVDSRHNYFYPLRVRPGKRAVALSEYGGIAWPMPGHCSRDKTYGYGTAQSRTELTARYKKLLLESVLPQLQNGLSVLVYTQLTDVEEEVNGILTYDRTEIKPDPAAVQAVGQKLRAEFARCTAPAKRNE